ncbi:MAG TPA: MMPL family transporter [Frankiaceae bacterium]|nr:MMPL family transporter [Frankiaceae bacterium]
MRRLAAWSFRHRAVVILLWVVLLALLAGVTKKVGKDYTDGFSLPGTESSRAQQLLAQSHLPTGSGDDTIVIHTSTAGQRLTDPAIKSAVAQVLTRAVSAREVTSIRSPYAAAAQNQISSDGRTAYAVIGFTQPDQKLTKGKIDPFVSVVSTLRTPQLQVEFGGGAFQSLKGSPFSGSVGIGLAAAAVVLFLAFGSLLATVIPLLAALFAVGAGIETVGLLSHALSINSITPSVAALIGIGVAVDYALFVVTRHRRGLRSGLTPEQSAVTALATSGRAVVFAGVTVAIAMLGLLILNIDFLTGVGLAAAITVGFAVGAATTLLPALFGLLGMKVLSRRERRQLAAMPSAGSQPSSPSAERSGPWLRWATFVQQHPVVLSVTALVIMVVLLLPALSIRLGSSDQGNDPSASTTRKAYDLLAQGFGPGFNGPLIIVGKTNDPASKAAFSALASKIKASPAVASVTAPPSAPDATVSILDVAPTTSPQSEPTTKLIDHLRGSDIPAAEKGTSLKVYIGGQTAVFQDFASILSSKLPIFLAVVILLGCLLLMIAFRSIVIPLTAAAMNVLAAGAAFGVVVAVFQWGWGSDALGLGEPGPIESFLPVMLIAILFGLSMDYQVFLVSRIHEEWTRTKDTARAVRVGQAETGRVISAAAAIMVVVFLAFALEGRRPIGEFGIGLAAAILLDALLLRTILVPAAMQLLGERNWWLPTWLDRVLPHVKVDAPESSLEHPKPTATQLPASRPAPALERNLHGR